MDDLNEINNDTQNAGIVDEKDKFLQFDLGAEAYAIALLEVKEVIPVPDTTSLPNSPSFYSGIMNLRGQIISILDLRKKMNIKPKEVGLEEAVIIVEIDKIAIGLIVDSINKVLNLQTLEIAEVPEVRTQVNSKFIDGVYKGDGNLTLILNLEELLNIKEIKKLQEKAA